MLPDLRNSLIDNRRTLQLAMRCARGLSERSAQGSDQHGHAAVAHSGHFLGQAGQVRLSTRVKDPSAPLTGDPALGRQPIGACSDHPMALASPRLHAGSVDDGEIDTRVADQLCRLQTLSALGHAFPAHAQRVGDAFMRGTQLD